MNNQDAFRRRWFDKAHRTFGKVFLGLLVAVIGISDKAFAQVVSGPIFGSDTSTIQNPVSYGKPNQSRIWYNSYQNRWDALVPKNDGGVSASDHYIMKDVSGTQTFTSVELEDRNNARPDILWDEANKRLYVLGSHNATSEFWQVHYDNLTDSYSINPQVNGVTVTGITHAEGNWPATLYVSPNGDMWVAVMKDNALQVQHSDDGGATWMSSPINLDTTVRLGVTTWTHFTDQGVTYVGLFAGENGDPSSVTRVYFWYIEQDADPSALFNWINDSSNIPAPVGAERSDDHVRADRDSNGNQYFVVKTESGNPTDPLIKLYKRTADGQWSQYKVTETQEVPEQTRPSIVIDEENSEIYVYMTDTFGGDGNRVKASLSSLEDLAANSFRTLFSKSNGNFDDLISPRHTVNSTSDIVVLSHNTTNRTVWFGREDIQTTVPPSPTPTPTPDPSPTPDPTPPPTPEEHLEIVKGKLQSIRDTSTNNNVRDEMNKSIEEIDKGLVELGKTPPDRVRAIDKIKRAIEHIKHAVEDGLNPNQGAQLMDELAGIARQIAVDAINQAIAQGANQNYINEARKKLAEGDALREIGKFREAADKYKQAAENARKALG